MSDLREYVKDRLARYPGMTCALHHDLRHWLMEHPPVADDLRAEIEAARAEARRRWPGNGEAGWVRYGYVQAHMDALAAHPVQVTTAEERDEIRAYLVTLLTDLGAPPARIAIELERFDHRPGVTP